MEKVEVQRIAHFLSDVYEGICEGDETVAMQQLDAADELGMLSRRVRNG